MARLLCSARALPEVIYRDELDSSRDGAEVSYTLTRRQPPDWTGFSRRIDAALLKEIAWGAETYRAPKGTRSWLQHGITASSGLGAD
jgi:hypothetical protein